MKIGMVLEGGGMRGLYTAGVLDAMLDTDLKINGIIGVSAGAVFGVNYVSKQKGRSLRYNQKYAKDPRYMGIRSFLKTGNFVNKDFAYYELPFKLDIFDEEAFSKSKIDFYATVTNVETGNPEYLKIINASVQVEELRASSSLPFVSKIVQINDKKYLDGGISDAIPIEKCLELGYDKIIVVTTRPLEYRKTKGNQFLPQIFYHKYPNFVQTINTRYQRYNDIVEKIIKLENENKIFVIRPSKLVDIKRLEKDPAKMQEIYDLGKEDFAKKYKDLQRYLKR